MKLIECPRDAMQGLPEFIPTETKTAYINQLLKVGFDTIDFGSFVSSKAIPQLKDTVAVLNKLDLSNTTSKLLVIVANIRGAKEAVVQEKITYLGYPFSISETFQQRNTNKSIAEALDTLNEIQELSIENNKELVAYISMGFGNPYDDIYDADIVAQFTGILASLGVKIISLADTIGIAEANSIQSIFTTLHKEHPAIEFGVHLHSSPNTTAEKIEAAHRAGCRRFDVAIRGFGGCPMAKDDLVGNIATETLLKTFKNQSISLGLDMEAFNKSLWMAGKIFPD